MISVSRQSFSFPRSLNEKAARVVAGVVAVTALVALLTGARWLLLPLAYGFWARTLTGPRLSPLALFATRVAAPRLGAPKEVPGPPKRFAQAIGAAITTTGTVAFALGSPAVADVTLVLLAVAATLESVFALCLGCKIFELVMRAGLIPEETCAACADIWSRDGARGDRASRGAAAQITRDGDGLISKRRRAELVAARHVAELRARGADPVESRRRGRR